MKSNEWHMSEKTIAKSKKNYAHFDVRTDISKCWEYISNPEKVARHGFYPFIHYDMKQIKYNDKDGKKEKYRSICYAAHIDRCIYQYYTYLLNQYYNAKVVLDGISNVSVAYRTDLNKSNIEFSQEAFNFIRAQGSCYVMIGDFTNFFDNLDHSYLKKQLVELLEVRQLPKDYYAVFKNVTRYTKCELTDLLKMHGLDDSKNSRNELNQKKKVISIEQFKEVKKQFSRNDTGFGIPQGSPISALLANIYMLTCDKKLNELVKSIDGFYMRYSDDFIIVLPNIDFQEARNFYENISNILGEIPRLCLQPDKTQFFEFCGTKLINCGSRFSSELDDTKSKINFLGFSFDGERISLRAKTVSKYYYRMYRQARGIANLRRRQIEGNHTRERRLYLKYSQKGASGKSRNFLSYVKRAQDVYKEESIAKDTEKHMSKIRKALK